MCSVLKNILETLSLNRLLILDAFSLRFKLFQGFRVKKKVAVEVCTFGQEPDHYS